MGLHLLLSRPPNGHGVGTPADVANASPGLLPFPERPAPDIDPRSRTVEAWRGLRQLQDGRRRGKGTRPENNSKLRMAWSSLNLSSLKRDVCGGDSPSRIRERRSQGLRADQSPRHAYRSTAWPRAPPGASPDPLHLSLLVRASHFLFGAFDCSATCPSNIETPSMSHIPPATRPSVDCMQFHLRWPRIHTQP